MDISAKLCQKYCMIIHSTSHNSHSLNEYSGKALPKMCDYTFHISQLSLSCVELSHPPWHLRQDSARYRAISWNHSCCFFVLLNAITGFASSHTCWVKPYFFLINLYASTGGLWRSITLSSNDWIDLWGFINLRKTLRPQGYLLLEWRKRHTWSFPSYVQLCLLLFYLVSKINCKHMCLLFGMTPSSCFCILWNMIKFVTGNLHLHDSTKLWFSSPEKMQQFALMTNHPEITISDVIGFMDGVSFKWECTSESATQNALYCRYDCDTTNINVFAYGPDGKVFLCTELPPAVGWTVLLTARFLPHIKKRISKYKICVDKGIPRSGLAFNILVRPYDQHMAWHLHPHIRDYLLCLIDVYISLWQASECGMHGLQGTFLRCKKHLPSDNYKRGLVMESIVVIHNFHTELMGLT